MGEDWVAILSKLQGKMVLNLNSMPLKLSVVLSIGQKKKKKEIPIEKKLNI